MTEISKSGTLDKDLRDFRTRLVADRFRIDALYHQAKNHLAERRHLSEDISYLCLLIAPAKK